MAQDKIADLHQWTDEAAILASKYVNSTSRHIFLTGRAGTGKTTFLHHIRKHTHKNTIVAAPTGIAAINAEGVTLHSLFQLPFGSFIPSDQYRPDNPPDFEINTPQSMHRQLKMNATKRNMLTKLELLIIDEVSMLRADLLDAIDSILRRMRRSPNQPFGGVQILFIGDLNQLPPVIKDPEWQVLNQYYETLFFFGARSLQDEDPVYLELEHIYRQSDPAFIGILNNLRDGALTKQDIAKLNQHHRPDFVPSDGDGYVFLTTHNYKADRINRAKLDKLPETEFQYNAQVEGKFDERAFPVDEVLTLKKGAQVMFIKNDVSGESRFFNGKIGFVDELRDEDVRVIFDDGSDPVWVDTHIWENKRYTLDKETNQIKEKVVGKFAHFPLKLAWAITIHKSQGLTFDKAVIDVSQAFAAGQVYVALSRLTSLDGLVLTSPFRWQAMAREAALDDFIERQSNVQSLAAPLKEAASVYLGEAVKEAFIFVDLLTAIYFHIRSYDKDATRSEKQRHLPWAESLRKDLGPVKTVADKFLQQLSSILEAEPTDEYAYLQERIQAAKQYFDPILIEFSERIGQHAATLQKTKKGVKKYIRELKEVELHFYDCRQKIAKALSLIQAYRSDSELTRAMLDIPRHNGVVAAGKAARPEKKSEKKSKIDTKIITLELFDQGRTVKEIAEERSFKSQTIENHLAYWIEDGKLDISRMVADDALAEITKAIDHLDTPFLKPVYEYFDGKYDYATLRFAAAFHKRTLEGEVGPKN